MRERMEEHRANPVCASCHKLMDPIGLSLENFDAVGAWRTRDGDSVTNLGTPIDAQGQLLDGTKVDGVVTLRKALVRQPDIFVSTLTEKLMIYALGRGLQPLRHAGGPLDRAGFRADELPLFVHDYGNCEKHAVSEANVTSGREPAPSPDVELKGEPLMFITKRTLSRRTILRGMGATLRLPFLEAMVPALYGGADSRSRHALRRDLRAARRAARLLDTEDGRHEFRVHADPEARSSRSAIT